MGQAGRVLRAEERELRCFFEGDDALSPLLGETGPKKKKEGPATTQRKQNKKKPKGKNLWGGRH